MAAWKLGVNLENQNEYETKMWEWLARVCFSSGCFSPDSTLQGQGRFRCSHCQESEALVPVLFSVELHKIVF